MSRKITAAELDALRLLREALFACEQQGIQVKHGSPGVYVLSADETWSICSDDDFLAPLDFKEVLPELDSNGLTWFDWAGDDEFRPKGLVQVEQYDGSVDQGEANSFLWYWHEDPLGSDILKWRPLR